MFVGWQRSILLKTRMHEIARSKSFQGLKRILKGEREKGEKVCLVKNRLECFVRTYTRIECLRVFNMHIREIRTFLQEPFRLEYYVRLTIKRRSGTDSRLHSPTHLEKKLACKYVVHVKLFSQVKIYCKIKAIYSDECSSGIMASPQ